MARAAAGHAGRGELHLDMLESRKDEHQNDGRLDVAATGRDQLQSTPPLAEVPGPFPPGIPRSRGREVGIRCGFPWSPESLPLRCSSATWS